MISKGEQVLRPAIEQTTGCRNGGGANEDGELSSRREYVG